LTFNQESSSAELQLARGYTTLRALAPAGHLNFVPLAALGNHEIRMVAPAGDAADGPMFWLELFNTRLEQTVDSYRCCNMSDAVPVFDHFMIQAEQPETND
jgi:hypothetical protein